MADQMMRMAVRGADGKAKAVKSDNEGKIIVSSDAIHTFGYIAVTGLIPSATIRGDIKDWRIGTGKGTHLLTDVHGEKLTGSESGNSSVLIDHLSSEAVKTAYDNGNSVWIGIDIATKGWRTFYTAITHNLNIGLEVSSYLAPSVDGTLSTTNNALENTLLWLQILSEATELPPYNQGGVIHLTPGGLGRNVFSQATSGVLILKITPISRPSNSGGIRIGVERQR